MNNQLQLVSFEQAKRLKEAGFDWFTDKFHATLPNGEIEIWGSAFCERTTPAPTVALALKWFRDVKKITMEIGDCGYDPDDNRYYDACFFIGDDLWNPTYVGDADKKYFTYEAAERALLDKLLTLIEKEK
jgi:hypothetical protein